MCPQAVVGVVAKDEEVAVGQAYFVDNGAHDERPFKSSARHGSRLCDALLGEFAAIHRGKGICEVIRREVVAEHLAVLQPARGEDACFGVRGLNFEQIFEAFALREHIVVHAPHRLCSSFTSLLDACIETAGAAYVSLLHHMQPRFAGEPFARAVGASVVHHDDFAQLARLRP